MTGGAATETRDAAIRKFGNPTESPRTDYEMNCWFLSSIGDSLRYGVRQLRRSPGFAIAAILSLALGIGANTAIFQLLDALRLRSLPVQRPDELVEVVVDGGITASVSPTGDFQRIRCGRDSAITRRPSRRICLGRRDFEFAAAGTAVSPRIWVSGGLSRRSECPHRTAVRRRRRSRVRARGRR